MRLSVIVPTRNHSADLERCLESVSKQTRKPDEIIVVDGHSTDDTPKVAKKYKCRLVQDDEGTIGNAYYVGAKEAKGDAVVFIDDDATAPKDWLESMEKALIGTDVVGGEDLLPEKSTAFQKAAYLTDLAVRPKDTVFGKDAWKWLRAVNIAYKKSLLNAENFDPRLRGLQEPELHERMKRTDAKAMFDPSIKVYHKRRGNLRGIWKQIYRNGVAKIDALRIRRSMLSFYDFAPFAFIAISLAALFFGYLQAWGALLVAYFLLKPFLISVKAGRVKYYPLLFAIIITKEVAYSLGILAGLVATWGRLK